MLKIAICDDETIFMHKILKPYINMALKAAKVTGEISFFTDGQKLIDDFKNDNIYDIVILDIDMPGLNGKQTAEKLRIINSSFFLIFSTSFKAEVYNTIPYRINAFISKDSDKETYIKELSRVFNEYIKLKPQYEIFEIVDEYKNKSVLKLMLNDIFYICCINKVIYLNTGTKEYILSEKRFESVVEKYLPRGFFEICRGYIVNLSRVKKANSLEIVLDNDKKLPVSRRKHKYVLEALSKMILQESDM